MRQYGVDDLILKPITKERLTQCIMRWRTNILQGYWQDKNRIDEFKRSGKASYRPRMVSTGHSFDSRSFITEGTRSGRASKEIGGFGQGGFKGSMESPLHQQINFTPFENSLTASSEVAPGGLDTTSADPGEMVMTVQQEPISRSPTVRSPVQMTPNNSHHNSLQRPPNPTVKQRRHSLAGTSDQANVASVTFPQHHQILVVDDSPANRGILVKMIQLVSPMCEISEASNGQDALRFCSQKKFSIIFMDLDMPVMTGEEASARIRAIGQQCPIIAVTGDNIRAENTGTLRQSGINDSVTKPISKALVQELLKQYLSSSNLSNKNGKGSQGSSISSLDRVTTNQRRNS
ncbi:hypothetical protein HDV05_002602, partial [Chytridiales sp. JEL 0842]